MSNSVKVDSTKLQVEAVTVFQSDRAEIRRNIKVELKAGQNEVDIEKLPTCLEEDSIRVDGYGNAVIFDVVYHPAPSPHTDSALTTRLDALNYKKDALSADKSVSEEEVTLFQAYGKTLKGQDTNLSQFTDFLTVFEKKRRDLYSGIKEIEGKLEELDKEIKDVQTQMHQDVDSSKRRVKITVIVLAEEDGPAEISLAYVVSGASWTPLYDLRAKISTSPKEPSTVSLHYRASISQSTGEDWSNVSLTLSTASPLLTSTIPALDAWTIQQDRGPVVWNNPTAFTMAKSKRKSASLLPEMNLNLARILERGEKLDTLMERADELRSQSHLFKRAARAVSSEGSINATFAIDGLSTIPSDTTENSQAHKVSIAEIDLNADLEWVSVPKEISAAFLQCQVKNTSQYVLLPGQSNVFMDGSFVAKSSIPNVSPQESFATSLGTDSSLRVTYHPLQKRTKSTGGALSLSYKTDVTTFTQSITIKNTRLTSVNKLIVKDQVPVSEDTRFKVTILEPRELLLSPNVGTLSKSTSSLPSASEAIAINGLKGARVRWAQKNEDGSGGDAGNGIIEWICDVPAGGKVEVGLSWEVSAPGGVRWS